MKVNKSSVEFAERLIRDGKINMDSDWSEAQPSAKEENEYLKSHSWSEYGKWFLATNEEEGDENDKAYYNFPYGDFDKVHRDGVIAAKQRAAQYDYADVEAAADELLKMIDKHKD